MSHLNLAWRDRDNANDIPGTYLEAASFARIWPLQNVLHDQFLVPSALKRGFILREETALKLIINGTHRVFECRADTPLDARELLDVDQDLAAGQDYYVYACYDDADPLNPGVNLTVSLNSTYPDGYDAQTSRKIGGFHTLCADMGTIAGHPLSGMAAGDILPTSLWCLTHRPTCNPEGMVYVAELDLWVDIYLQSGTGTFTRSANGATITDTRTWFDHVDDLAAVGKTLLTDTEFQICMEGSNQMSAIQGAADPVTTGGHVDSAGRRMVSKYGLEDGCGTLWQWLDHPSANGPYSGTDNPPYNGSVASGWMNRPGNKGSLAGMSYAALAGGGWSNSTLCGSRCRCTFYPGTLTHAYVAARGRARSL